MNVAEFLVLAAIVAGTGWLLWYTSRRYWGGDEENKLEAESE